MFIVRLLAMLAVALGVGFGLSYFALTDGRLFGAVRVGPWAAWPDVGVAAPDPYTRAYLSRNGVLQLGQSEGVQFVAVADGAGQPLSRQCTYRVEGSTPVTAFWTLQATTPEGENVAHPDGLIGFHSERLVRRADGAARLWISPRLAPGNWLQTTGSGPMHLVLTLYDSAIFSGSAGAGFSLPLVVAEGCA